MQSRQWLVTFVWCGVAVLRCGTWKAALGVGVLPWLRAALLCYCDVLMSVFLSFCLSVCLIPANLRWAS